MVRAGIALVIVLAVAAGCGTSPNPTLSTGTASASFVPSSSSFSRASPVTSPRPSSAPFVPGPSSPSPASPSTIEPPAGTPNPSEPAPSGPSAAASDGSIAAPADPSVVRGTTVNQSCTAIGISPHVAGRLQGNLGDAAWPVWVSSLSGRQLFVRWPAGFRVTFNGASVSLLDETGRVVSTGSIDLGQVGIDEAAGTREDPYIAQGLMFGTCYVRVSPANS